MCIRDSADGDVPVLVVGVGEMVATAVEVASALEEAGFPARVVDPRWALPVSSDIIDLARQAQTVLVIEDGLAVGGVGTQIARAVERADLPARAHCYGIPQRFLAHASRTQILEEIGLTPAAIADDAIGRMRA